MVATGGNALMFSSTLAAFVQPFPSVTVFFTVYAPGALVVRSTSPVLVLTNTKPAGVAVKVPSTAPLLGFGFEGGAGLLGNAWQ